MKRITMYMAAIAVLLLSCNNNRSEKEKVATADMAMSPAYKTEDNKSYAPGQLLQKAESPAIDTANGSGNIASPQAKTTVASHEDWDKKIIKTAEVTLELKDYTGYNQTLHKGLKAYGAYIAAEEQSLSDDRNSNNVTIKVPVEQFDNLMNSFSGDGIKVLQKKISSEDVTGEVVDTRSRMEAKKHMRDRYLDLLKQARNMKEILEVQREINSIQEDIESGSGRVAYLTHQSAYSTIHLQYFQYLNPDNRVKQPSGFLLSLKESFKDGLRIISGLLILLVSIWPLTLGGIILFTYLWKKRRPNIIKQ